MLVCAAGLEHTPHFSTFGRCQLRRDAHQPRGPVPPVRPRARPLAWRMGLPGGAHCPPSWELSPENFLEARNGFLSVARSPAPLPTRAVHSSPGYAHAHRRSRPRVFVAGQTFPLSAPPGLNARFIPCNLSVPPVSLVLPVGLGNNLAFISSITGENFSRRVPRRPPNDGCTRAASGAMQTTLARVGWNSQLARTHFGSKADLNPRGPFATSNPAPSRLRAGFGAPPPPPPFLPTPVPMRRVSGCRAAQAPSPTNLEAES